MVSRDLDTEHSHCAPISRVKVEMHPFSPVNPLKLSSQAAETYKDRIQTAGAAVHPSTCAHGEFFLFLLLKSRLTGSGPLPLFSMEPAAMARGVVPSLDVGHGEGQQQPQTGSHQPPPHFCTAAQGDVQQKSNHVTERLRKYNK